MRRLLFKCLQLNHLALSRSLNRVRSLVWKQQKEKANDIIYRWHLLSLGVLPNYRGAGIGKNLIREFEKKCLSNYSFSNSKVATCTIGAYKWNTNGCRLYEKSGYRFFEESRNKLKYIKELS